MLGAVAALIYVKSVRPWHLHWGASVAELRRWLPGDDLVPYPRLTTTRGVTIFAPVEDVWPWLVQIGQGRGGFYSYDWLENLFGLDIHSADRIIPEFQKLDVGDTVRLEPGGMGPKVMVLEPRRVLALGGWMDPRTRRAIEPADQPLPDHYLACVWIFYVERVTGRSTRLIVRFRLDWKPATWTSRLGYRGLLEPAHFIMERKMLLGIKARAEGRTPQAASRLPAP